jgi:hypothetical protein
MKHIIFLFSILTLFQNCKSYQTFDLKTHEIINGRKYKIAKTNKFSKVRITNVSDSIVYYLINGLPQQIHLRDIREIESKKTDVAKVVAVTALTLGVLSVIAASQVEYKITFDKPLIFP